VLDHLHNLNHDLAVQAQQLDKESNPEGAAQLREKITEATGIIENISKVKYEMGRDKELESVFRFPRICVS
jgi:hypothetical protein